MTEIKEPGPLQAELAAFKAGTEGKTGTGGWSLPPRPDLLELVREGTKDAFLAGLIADLLWWVEDKPGWRRTRVDRATCLDGTLAIEWGFVHGEAWVALLLVDPETGQAERMAKTWWRKQLLAPRQRNPLTEWLYDAITNEEVGEDIPSGVDGAGA